MPGFLAGEVMTAGKLNRLQTKTYNAVGSGTLTGPLTNADIVGATVTMVTETAGATYKAWCVFDFNMTAASSGTELGRMSLDGTPQSPLSTKNSPDSSGRATVPQNYSGTLAAAGSHTFKLIASPFTNQQVQGVNCSIIVEITEVV